MDINTRSISDMNTWVETKFLGQGTFGRVYLYTKIDENKQMAVKFYDKNAEYSIVIRNIQEVNLIKKIQHKNIISFISPPADFLNPMAFKGFEMVCMEYCDLGDLRKVIRNPENLMGAPQNTVLKCILDISSGLDYLHYNNIIHRDIKPDNILLKSHNSSDEIIFKLVDFGFATQFSVNSAFNSFVGTMQYFAPEMLDFSTRSPSTSAECAKPNSAVDLWALGIVIFELITGSRPFIPELPGFDWVQYIKDKLPEHILIYKDEFNEVQFSSEILLPHQLSTDVVAQIEEWLQLMLNRNPKLRGNRSLIQGQYVNLWYEQLQSLFSYHYITVIFLQEMKIIQLKGSANETICDFLLKTSLQNADFNKIIILTANGTRLIETDTIQKSLVDRFSGELYVFPLTFNSVTFPNSDVLSPDLVNILESKLGTTKGSDFPFIIKPVIKYMNIRAKHILHLLRLQSALEVYCESLIQEISELSDKLRMESNYLFSICMFLNEDVLPSIDSFFLANSLSHGDQTTYIKSLWNELTQTINSLLPEVKAFDRENCSDKVILAAKNVFKIHSVNVSMKEFNLKFSNCKFIICLLRDMIGNSTSFINGTDVGKHLISFLKMVNSLHNDILLIVDKYCVIFRDIFDCKRHLLRCINFLSDEFKLNLKSSFILAFEKLLLLFEQITNDQIKQEKDPETSTLSALNVNNILTAINSIKYELGELSCLQRSYDNTSDSNTYDK